MASRKRSSSTPHDGADAELGAAARGSADPTLEAQEPSLPSEDDDVLDPEALAAREAALDEQEWALARERFAVAAGVPEDSVAPPSTTADAWSENEAPLAASEAALSGTSEATREGTSGGPPSATIAKRARSRRPGRVSEPDAHVDDSKPVEATRVDAASFEHESASPVSDASVGAASPVSDASVADASPVSDASVADASPTDAALARALRASVGGTSEGEPSELADAARDAAGIAVREPFEMVERLDDPSIALGIAREHLRGLLESLLFMSPEPMSTSELCAAASAERATVVEILAELRATYRSRGFRLDEVAGGWSFRTNPAYAPFLRDMTAQKPVRLTRAQIETLAIVAYRQPTTRPEVDDVRGVDSGAVLKTLLERDLIRIMGKRDEAGRPLLYGTTQEFLAFFGLRSLRELPTLREFSELTDDSRRLFARETGEAPPDLGASPEGLAGGEGIMGSSVSPSGPPDVDESMSGGDVDEHDQNALRADDAYPGATADAEAESAPVAEREAVDEGDVAIDDAMHTEPDAMRIEPLDDDGRGDAEHAPRVVEPRAHERDDGAEATREPTDAGVEHDFDA